MHSVELFRKLALELSLDSRISMAEVAKRVGMSRATLHRHFSTREQLIFEVGSFAQVHLTAAMPEPAGNALDRLEALIHYWTSEPELYRFLCVTSDVVVKARWIEQRRSCVDLVRAGQQEGSIRIDLMAEWIVEALDALICSAVKGVAEGVLPRQALGEKVSQLLLCGVSSRKTA